MITQILKEIIEDIRFRFKLFLHPISIQGFWMYIDPKASYVMRKTFRYYLKYRVHEPATTKLFRKIVKRNDVVIDIGANLGYFSLLAGSLGAKVYAFEPEPTNFEYLEENIKLNSFNIIPSDLAISDKKGSVDLFLCGYDSGHHTINQDKGIKDYRETSLMRKCMDLFIPKEKYVKIQTIRLDDLIEKRNLKIDIIKMDCEGAEALVLKGMDKVLKENEDIQMIVEFFPLLLRSMGSSPKKFISKLIHVYKFKISIIPDDYNAGARMVEVKNYYELISHCPGREDHLNLYLTKK